MPLEEVRRSHQSFTEKELSGEMEQSVLCPRRESAASIQIHKGGPAWQECWEHHGEVGERLDAHSVERLAAMWMFWGEKQSPGASCEEVVTVVYAMTVAKKLPIGSSGNGGN